MPRSLPALLASLTAALLGCNELGRVSRVNSAPDVVMVSPLADQAFRQGEGDIPLVATVSDSFDRSESLTVSFRIDAANPLAASPDVNGRAETSVSPDTLALGSHDAVVTVVDEDGGSATAGVRFVVLGAFGAPTVAITAPDDAYLTDVGSAITFRGEASDSTTAASGLTFVWASDVDGALPGAVSAGGSSLLLAEGLSAGVHAITLTVTDEDGDEGSDSITVTLLDEEVVAEPGDLVFSEFMVNPEVVDDELGEWVELYNTSGAPIDLAGYRFHDDDNDSFTLPGPLLVAPHGYIVLCADTDPARNGGVPCDGWFLRDYTGLGLALANNPDEIVLSRPDGVEIDWVHYEDNWFLPGAASGVSPDQLEGGANDSIDAWCIQTTIVSSGGEPGTPGVENDVCE